MYEKGDRVVDNVGKPNDGFYIDIHYIRLKFECFEGVEISLVLTNFKATSREA
jgi:hypothetical protein